MRLATIVATPKGTSSLRYAYVTGLILGCLLMFSPQVCMGQVLYGSIVGDVKDPSGAAVPGATVTLTNRGTNQSRDGTTNPSGSYSFLDVQSGTYSIKVRKAGFKNSERAEIQIALNSVMRVDVTLEVGAVTQTVTVTSEAEPLQTDTSEVHAEVTTAEVENMPVPLGRNYQQLYRALPGFTPPSNSHSIPTNPARALEFNVNGTSNNQNNTRVDGVSTYNVQLPHVNSYVPTLDSIQEVNIVTDTFDAEQGFAGGAAINLETKSGTNRLHGSIFESHSDSHLGAWPMQFDHANLNVGNKPKFIDNDFGGSAGGPIKKNRLFFFASYEGLYQRQAAQRFADIPTRAMRAGDLRSSSAAVYDPLTGNQTNGLGRTQFVSFPADNPACTSAAGCPNVIPSSRLDPIALKILSFVPPPNLPGDNRNYFVNGPFKWNRNQVDSKINFIATTKLNFIGTFGMLRYSDLAPTIFGDKAIGRLIGPGGNPGQGHGDTYRTTIMGTYTISSNFLMDAHFGYAKQGTNSEQQGLGTNIGRDVLGIPGTNGTRPFESGWPQFDISGFDTIGVTFNFMPYYRHDPQYQYVANFNWIKGNHNVRFGTDLYRQQLNHTQAEFLGTAYGAQGGFDFNRGVTQTCLTVKSNGTCATTSTNSRNNGIASFLLGLPDRRSRTLQVPDVYHISAWLYSAYVRDRWNITPKLTADYGLRWEYYPIPTRPDRGIERYDMGTNQILLCGVGSVPRDCGIQNTKKHFAPRIGFAYRAKDTLVVRAGYGITIDPYEALELLRVNYPLLAAFNQTDNRGSLFPVGQLKDGIPPIPPPDTSSGKVNMPPEVGYGGWPSTMNRGYVQSWNFTIQKQLGGGFTGQVGYVATRSVRQLAFMNFNAGQVIGLGDPGRPLFPQFGRKADTLLVYPVGTGHYDALQAMLQRRFRNGLALTVNYTWGKAINNVDNSGNQPRIKVFKDQALNRAVTGFDRTHNLEIVNIWQLPFGTGKQWVSGGGVMSKVLGGWQVNSLVSVMTGRPFTVTGGSGFNTPGSTQTADQVKPQVSKFGVVDPNLPYYDPAAFAPTNGARYGTSGFNILRGPGIFDWDFGVFRNFPLTERFRFEFRAESFNFTNTPHFSNPRSDASDSSTFMTIARTSDIAREGIDQRQFRLSLRLTF